MIKEEKIQIKINNTNKSYFLSKGYELENGDKTAQGVIYTADVKIHDLSTNSHAAITAICTKCDAEKSLMYYKYVQNVNRHGFYTCKACSRGKAKITNNMLFGHDSYMQSDEGKEKYRQTCMDRYGVENVLLVHDIQQKKQNTCILKYNSKSPLTHLDIKTKSVATNMKRYGAASFNKSVYFKNKIQKTWVNFYMYKLPRDYDIHNFEILNENLLKILCTKCDRYYEIPYKLLYQRVKLYDVCPCTECNPINSNISCAELELFDYIKQFTNTEQTNKTILNGKHLDIYCKDVNLAVEYNGVFWHSEKYKTDTNYHYNKSTAASKQNIKLFHVFENEWKHNSNNIKTLLRNHINKSHDKFTSYTVSEITQDEIKYTDISTAVLVDTTTN